MKHKAQLCAHGGMQKWSIDFWETYSPVVNWITVRTLLTIAAIQDLPASSIDFVLAFHQAELDVIVYMELPIGMDIQHGVTKDYVLRLNKSINGLKQSSLNWFNLLPKALQKKGRDFRPSKVDPCMFVKDDCILLVYVDDVLVIGKSKDTIERFISSLKSGVE
eukprot:7927440-Ditylum_brightwellii.AAC.1